MEIVDKISDLIDKITSKLASDLGMSQVDALTEFKTSATYRDLVSTKSDLINADADCIYDLYISEFDVTTDDWLSQEEEEG